MAATDRPKLTERQREVLDFIAGFMRENQYAPSVREICDAMGFASLNGAACHLTALERKGYIRAAVEGMARTVTPIGCTHCAYCGTDLRPQEGTKARRKFDREHFWGPGGST